MKPRSAKRLKPVAAEGVYGPMTLSENPEGAWERLPDSEWNEASARHLLRRAGWTARAEDVAAAKAAGLERTLERLFPAAPLVVPPPPSLARLAADAPELMQKVRAAAGFEKRAAQREVRERAQAAMQDYRLAWLQTAGAPENSAVAKWNLFLGDVYVVSAEKVRNPSFIARHYDLLATHGFGRAPDLTKAVSRSPAMELYLDLAQSKPEAPNENFARELFELFVLGEGHYSERDIKEAARAFTGYRVNPVTGETRFVPRQHDSGAKTVFGRTGPFAGDAVIDLAYEQPAAAEFLPGELARFYLSDQPLPPAYRAAIGAKWREEQLDLGALARRFFGSRLFFAPEFRGNFIKSPVQLYLGLVQDLGLGVPPLARYTLFPLRQMGQELFQPPNVRGWVGGRQWINSATLAARRQVVQQVFAPLREETLNADEQRALAEARTTVKTPFTVSHAWCEERARIAPATLADDFVATFLAGEPAGDVRAAVGDFLRVHATPAGVHDAAVALLQSPEYQLC